MKLSRISIALLVLFLLLAPALFAQSTDAANQSVAAAPAPTASAAEVPRLIKFSGTLLDEQGQALKGPAGVTFALYAQQNGGAALWLETQNVKSDGNGNYMVLLGANTAGGVPAELFVSGEARWLGLQVGQQPEHERILLVSVPYALKAGDAETLGGKPLSSFVLNEASATGSSAGSAAVATSSAAGRTQTATGASAKTSATPQAVTPCSSVTSDGAAAVNSIALFTTACNVESSVITQSSGNVGIGTATPSVAVDVLGNNAGLRLNGTGTHQVTVTSTTTGVSGRLGQDANGFFFASDTNGKAVRFLTNNGTLNEWMRITSAGNVGIGTAAPAFNLDVNGLANFAATNNSQVLSVNQNGSGVAIFAATPSSVGTAILGRANAGSASGSAAVTGINSATSGTAFGVTGEVSSPGGIAGVFDNHAAGLILSGQANGSQKFSVDGFGNVGLTGSLSLPATTSATVGVISLGGASFAHNFGTSNTFLGSNAGNFTMSGLGSNTAVGASALKANTTGFGNTALGTNTLLPNTTGSNNTAIGAFALGLNATGSDNTALGVNALLANTAGSSNTAVGSRALQANTASSNTAVGFNALHANTAGGNNTALGANALQANLGLVNTAVGASALQANTTGNASTAVGFNALAASTMANNNTAVGVNALATDSTGGANTAVGLNALELNSTGNGNTAIGEDALMITIGSNNIAIGVAAGSKVTTGNNNILIFDSGTSGDNQVIRVGTEGTQTQTFIAGISGAGVAGSAVLVSPSGQLGIAVSTRSAKEDIHNMGDLSQRLLQLRPVTFRYRKPLADGSKPLQYGLIAEEVAEVMPELVVYGRDGQPETVQYHVLPALLLNELQKHQQQIRNQQERIRELTVEVRKLRKVQQAMAQLEARLANLESQQKSAQATVPNDKARDRSSGPATTQGR